MASQAAAIKYASRSTNGSAAYDLNRVRGYAPFEIPLERPQSIPTARPAVRPQTRAEQRAKAAYGISAFAVVGFLVTAVMIVFVLLAYVQYTEVSNETVQLQNQLSALSETENKLLVSYESAFNINEIEEYATTVLGMVKPTGDQIETVTTSSNDKAVVLVSDTESEGLLTGLSAFFSSLMEYFKS